MNKKISIMLNTFLSLNLNIKLSDIQIWAFGDNQKMSKELAKLVLEGKKTGTSSDYILYKNSDELPKINSYHLITDFNGTPFCIIQIINVELIPFNRMNSIHALKEGEGDLSYEYWYNTHKLFFMKERQKQGIKFSEDMIVVFETFKMVFN